MYNHAPEDYVCPFCLIVKGIEHESVHSLQNDIVYRAREVTAFVGSHQWPNNHGNIIVIPNEHFENIYDLPVHFVPKMHEVAKAIALTFKLVYSCDGVSTRQHNELAGGQDVWHYHSHVTPRYQGDQLYTSQREFMPAIERAKHADQIKPVLAEMMRRFS